MKKNLEVERLRGVAILLVFIAHTISWHSLLPVVFKHSWVGVDLFFVISGYVVSLSLLRLLPATANISPLGRIREAKSAFKIFYLRRVFRILPLALVWLSIHLILTACMQTQAADMFGTLKQILWEDLFFFLGVFNYWRDHTAIQGQLWSLSVEEHFYALLPLLFVLFPRMRSRFIVSVTGIILVAFVLRPFIPPFPGADLISFQSYTSHRKFDALFFGVLIALMRPSEQLAEQSGTSSWYWNLISIALVLLFWALPGFLSEPERRGWGFTLYGLVGFSAVFLASYRQGYIFPNRFISRILEHIGARSYGLYLSHVPLGRIHMWLLREYPAVFGSWYIESVSGKILQGFVLLAVNLIICEITFRMVERPLIQLGGLFTGRIKLGVMKV